MRWTCLTLMVLAGCSSAPTKATPKAACATDVGISGRVVDQSSGEPLWMVQISTLPKTEITHTNQDGCFVIKENPAEVPPELQPGQYRVVIEPVPGQVKGRDNNAVVQVYAAVTSVPVDYPGEPVSAGTMRLETLSAGEGDEVIFTPANSGHPGRTMDE